VAHVGVLSVLDDAGVPIDLVTGSSAGALVGALFCAGLSPAELVSISTRIGWRDVARPIWPRDSLVTFQPLEELLVALLGDVTFADLERPFAAVTVDVETGQEVVLSEGRLAPAVHASCAVPGLVRPRSVGGRRLGDGGIINNLPASVPRQMGAGYVIGVDVMQPSFHRRWGPLGPGLAALELLVAHAGRGEESLDCLIRPALAGMSYLRLSQAEKLIRLGAQAAQDALPALTSALAL
jgi:NTE family protein